MIQTGPTSPAIANVHVPDDLSERDSWLLWRYEGGAKVPYQANGRKASSTDPSTWTDFQHARAAWQRYPKHFAGVGFVFHADDPFAGIDLDNCLDEQGALKEWARGVVEAFFDSYAERSPSGRGVKIWVRGTLPSNLPKVKIQDGGIELYDRERYFTVTGRVFNGAPLQIEDHASELLGLHAFLTRDRRVKHRAHPDGRIPYGTQHSTLVRIAGSLRWHGVGDEGVLACLLAVNERQCERPGPRANVERIVRSTSHWRQST